MSGRGVGVFKVAWYASEMGKYKEAEEMNQSAFKARDAALGAEHAEIPPNQNIFLYAVVIDIASVIVC